MTHVVLFFHLKSIDKYEKIFKLIVSFVLLAGFSACNKDGSDKPGLPPAPVPTVNYKGLTFISSGKSTVCLAKVGGSG